MQQPEQIRLLERALKHIDEKTSDREGSFTVPAHFYTSPEQLRREREILFTRFPLVAGFSSQVRKPGDFFAFEFGDQSILVTRGEDGRLNALANFCRHRGTKLVEGAGNSRRFVCPYHAWSYAPDGRLLTVPHRENFPDLSSCNLNAFPVGEKYGLVWVKPTMGGTMDLERELGGLPVDLESFGFASHVHFEPRTFRSPINWKLMIEASLETYHFKYTHQKTIAPMFFDDLGVFDWGSPHGRMFLPKQSIKDLKTAPREQWAIRPHGNIIYFFFPNTVLLVQPDHATWMSSYPVSERESLIHGGTLIPEVPANEKAEKYWQKNVEIFWQALNEDFAMSEKIQLGLNSGYVKEVLFGRSEYLVRHYHEEIGRALS
jgi:phenylpropionate dioxygenase-like ring-hydroxylating dioxygenase large terminal subunit